MTQEELNELVQRALADMVILKNLRLWSRLEVTQFNVPHVQLVVGPVNFKGEKETEYGTYIYYMGVSGPRYRVDFGG